MYSGAMGKRRVMITGGSGRLGRHVVRAMAGSAEVSVLDLAPPADDVAFHRVDIRDSEACRRALRGHDAVIHLAGIDDGDAARPRDYLEVNAPGAWNVFEAALAADIAHIVVASSTAVLGLGAGRPPDYLPVDEAHSVRPSDEYGLSKQLIEAQAAWIARTGRARVVCLRPTLIVRPEMEARIRAQLALPHPDAPPPAGATEAYGALAPSRSYVRSADAARAFRLALDHEGADFEVVQIAAADTIGRIDTLARLGEVWGRLPEVRDAARFAADPAASILDAGHAAAVLDWRAEGDWRDVAGALRQPE